MCVDLVPQRLVFVVVTCSGETLVPPGSGFVLVRYQSQLVSVFVLVIGLVFLPVCRGIGPTILTDGEIFFFFVTVEIEVGLVE